MRHCRGGEHGTAEFRIVVFWDGDILRRVRFFMQGKANQTYGEMQKVRNKRDAREGRHHNMQKRPQGQNPGVIVIYVIDTP